MPDGDLVLKQWVSVIDARTTIICLDAAGQIRRVDEAFDTLNGPYDAPPAHIHCRSIVAPWMPGFGEDLRKTANAELMRRPLKYRRKGPDGLLGAPRVPPPSTPPPTGLSVTDELGYVPARYTDVDQIDWSDAPEGWVTPDGGDEGLHWIADQQGWNGLPTVVPRSQWDDMAQSGGTVLYRGDMATFNDQFLSGRRYMGRGIAGNGTYFSDDLDTARAYADRDGSSVLSVMLRPNARVIDSETLRSMYQKAVRDPKLTYGPARLAFADAGRYAAALGYDAIRWDAGREVVLVVLNRTAVVVSA